MDASVQRVQPEPVVAGSRGSPRARERHRRERRDEAGPRFVLDPRSAPEHGAHVEPRSPRGDGLGEQLDVTA